jgi:hypothetical protein
MSALPPTADIRQCAWDVRKVPPVFINLDNVLTVERQGALTTVVMVGGEKICVDTLPETLIGAVAPAGRL